MDYNAQIQLIKDAGSTVKLGKLTVLTGKNGSGKSLLRKLMGALIAKQTGTDPSHTVASVSMESRTQRKFDFSALNSLGIDDPTNPTSGETLYNIESLVKAGSSESKPRYIVIDEPEIGMGEEMVAALAIRLNEMFKKIPKSLFGVMIITHNRHLVKNLKGEFINLEGMTKKEWLNRKIIPTDIEQFKEDSLELYRAIENYGKDKK